MYIRWGFRIYGKYTVFEIKPYIRYIVYTNTDFFLPPPVNVKPLFTTPKDVLSNFAIHKASFQMQPLSKNQSYSN